MIVNTNAQIIDENKLNNLIISTVLVLFITRFLYSFPLRGRYRFSPFLGGCYWFLYDIFRNTVLEINQINHLIIIDD